jgi:AcrR family transcriptional regulator
MGPDERGQPRGAAADAHSGIGGLAMGRPPASVRSPAETRSRLVDAAIDVFLEVGYQRASIKEIAARAGVTSGTIYRHFDSKSDLLRVAIDTARTSMRDRPDTPGGSRSLIGGILADYTDPALGRLRRIAVLMHDAASQDEHTRSQLIELQAAAHARLVEQIAAAIDDDELPADLDPEHVASLLVVVAMGLSHLEVLQPDLIGDTAFVRYVEDAIGAGIASPTGRPGASR